MTLLHRSLWEIATGSPQIDSAELAAALEDQATRTPLDWRTRVLVRDGLEALARHWGAERLAAWLEQSPQRSVLENIRRSDLGQAGFPSIQQRIMDATQPHTVHQFLRELGLQIANPLRIEIGQSIALILQGNLSRATEDIDLVDEVPADIRSRHELLDQLAQRYGLRVTRFQSHYLPNGWRSRVRSLGRFGQLDVFAVDVYDIFAGKLFSAREKDLDDLRVLSPQLEKGKIEERLKSSAAGLLANPALAQNAAKNWYILYGEALPALSAGE